VEARERALELIEAESGGSGVNRKDRRRIQNRLAQRAFRARSKVHKQEVSVLTLTSSVFKKVIRRLFPLSHPSSIPNVSDSCLLVAPLCPPQLMLIPPLQLSDYMIHLETLTDAQEERLLKMHALIERLQKENTCLKMNSWQAIQAGGTAVGVTQNKIGPMIGDGRTAVA